jgi:hypothetical protein
VADGEFKGVVQLMGHKTVGTTGLYIHLFREAYADVERALDAVYGAGSADRNAPSGPVRPARVPASGRPSQGQRAASEPCRARVRRSAPRGAAATLAPTTIDQAARRRYLPDRLPTGSTSVALLI